MPNCHVIYSLHAKRAGLLQATSNEMHERRGRWRAEMQREATEQREEWWR